MLSDLLLLSFTIQHFFFLFINIPDATVAVAYIACTYIAEGLPARLTVQSARRMKAVRSAEREEKAKSRIYLYVYLFVYTFSRESPPNYAWRTFGAFRAYTDLQQDWQGFAIFVHLQSERKLKVYEYCTFDKTD